MRQKVLRFEVFVAGLLKAGERRVGSNFPTRYSQRPAVPTAQGFAGF